MKAIQLLGAVSAHAAAIPAAVGEDRGSPYGFTPSKFPPFLPPPLPSKPSFSLKNPQIIKHKPREKLQLEGSLLVAPGLLHPAPDPTGKEKLQQKTATPSLHLGMPLVFLQEM